MDRFNEEDYGWYIRIIDQFNKENHGWYIILLIIMIIWYIDNNYNDNNDEELLLIDIEKKMEWYKIMELLNIKMKLIGLKNLLFYGIILYLI